MPRVAIQLEAWRCAERLRRALEPGSPEWQAADEAVRHAQAAYRAELAQAAAFYDELDFAAHDHPFPRLLAQIDRSAARNR